MMESSTDDRKLIGGFLGGDPAATQMIATWIRDTARHAAWGSPEAAEEGAADATLKLLLQLRAGRFRGDASLRTYVTRITRYTMIDLLRRRRTAEEHLRQYRAQEPPAADPETELLDAERVALFDRIVSLLDEKCRKLWELILGKRLPYKEIAAREGITPTAVKMRAYHCKEKAIAIRKELEAPLPRGTQND